MVQTIIVSGKAVVTFDGLRCNSPRKDDASKSCNKLLAKANSSGQIAGHFRCDRCKAEVETRAVRL
jgi:phage FluMu protein Com